MQRHAHRALAHRKFCRGVLDRGAVDGDRLQHLALARRQRLSCAATSLAGAVSGGGSPGSISAKSSMLTKTRRPRRRSASISLLRAIANSHGANGAFGVPGMPLQMHRQQNVLHDVLGLIGRLPGPRQTRVARRPQHRRDRLQQAMIRRDCRRKWPPASGRSTRLHVRARALPPCNSVDLSVCYDRDLQSRIRDLRPSPHRSRNRGRRIGRQAHNIVRLR